jgi:hypothetical protein
MYGKNAERRLKRKVRGIFISRHRHIKNQGFGSGSRMTKMTHKNRKKSRIFMFLSTRCSLLRAEGFSCSWASFMVA